MVPCPRCRGPVAETTAVCPHCEAYLLEWDPIRGRLGPTTEAQSSPQAARGGDADARPPIFGEHRAPTTLDTHRSLGALRWLCGVGMALHALLVLIRLVEPGLTLLAWVVLWLPLDAFWRSTR